MIREFEQTVRDITGAEIDFDLEFCGGASKDDAGRLQVASSGFSYEELMIIKQSYLEVRDRLIGTRAIQRLPMSISPLKSISWDSSASGITGSF